MTAAETGVDRSAPPPPDAVSGFRFPDYVRHRLDNGLTVLAAQGARGPLVHSALLFPAGADRDPREGDGTATLVGAMVDEGTAERSALDIAAAVENLGGRLGTGADWDVGHLDIHVLSHHAGEALRLLAELGTGSTFPADELERQRRRRLTDLLRRKSDPSYLAVDRFASAVYAGTPYGHTLQGNEASAERLARDAVVDFYRRHYALADGVLVTVGDLDPETLVRMAEEVFGHLPGGEPSAQPTVEPPALSGVDWQIVDRPHAVQAELRIGHSGPPRSHPDYVTLTVMNALLGGKFTSRINLNLRERQGYTYGAHSSFSSRRGPGPFVVRTAVAKEVAVAAVNEVLGELERITQERVETEELDDAKNYLIGTFPYTLQTVSGLLDRLETLAVHGLPADYYDRLPQTIGAVTKDDVLRVAQEHLRPKDLVVVAVGPEEEIRGQLEE